MNHATTVYLDQDRRSNPGEHRQIL